jgi:D-amino peptidase
MAYNTTVNCFKQSTQVLEGAMAAGATEFWSMILIPLCRILMPATLPETQRYLSGKHKPMYMMQGLDTI